MTAPSPLTDEELAELESVERSFSSSNVTDMSPLLTLFPRMIAELRQLRELRISSIKAFADQERARIVKWLRTTECGGVMPYGTQRRALASAIERGEHEKAGE